MKKQIKICQQCVISKYSCNVLWCAFDDFDKQENVFYLQENFEDIPPPTDCPYVLEHTVLTPPNVALSAFHGLPNKSPNVANLNFNFF